MISLEERLRNQYGKHGIYAGSTHFKDYWCRDSMFASFGALALGDYEVVGSALNNFLDHLRDDGHVAMRIGTKNQVLRYLRLPTTHGVHHFQDKGSNDVYDSNSLVLILAQKYEEFSGNKLNRNKLTSVLGWADANDKDGLLHEGEYASWEDSLKHRGARLYTNVCHYRSLHSVAELFANPFYRDRAEETKEHIQEWWKGDYFADGANSTCMVGGNLLAILWGIATKEQAVKILAHIAKRKSICPPAGFWKPRPKDVFLPFFLIHLEDYHGMMEWSWLAAAEIAAYRFIGEDTEANHRFAQVLRLMEHYGTLHEVYEHDRPVNRLVYRSEKDFAWGLGMLVASRNIAVII